jgi:hypothetical protein
MKLARILSASCGIVSNEKTESAARVAANRRMIVEALERAAKYRPDFVCFPEVALQAGCGGFAEMAAQAEPVPGPTVDLVAGKARALRSHVILPLFERERDRVYNTAVLIGRDGAVIGKYRKFHATGYEIKEGVTPGCDVPVWDTDCGRIGIAICFDLKFPAVGLALSRGQAQCVFFPTMFYGGQRLVSWAMDYGFHLVRCHGSGGRIVDPTGATLGIEGQPEPMTMPEARLKWTFAEVNLDHRTYHLDFHYDKMAAIAAKYGAGVLVRRMPEEGTFNLVCNLPDRTIDDVEREFELKSLRRYLDEASDVRDAVLRAASPSTAP